MLRTGGTIENRVSDPTGKSAQRGPEPRAAAPGRDPHIAIATRSGALVAPPSNRIYHFGPYRLEALTRRLLKAGEEVALAPKAFDLLVSLIERRQRAVGKAELMQLLWPDSYVAESNLTQTVFVLRKTLGDTPDGSQYIATVPRHGYRFTAPVEEAADAAPAPPGDPEPVDTTATAPLPPSTAAAWRPRLVVASIALVLLVSAAYFAITPSRDTPNAAAPRAGLTSLAVLPFKALWAGGDEAEYLGVGMADTLITRLGNVRQITVRSTRSVLDATKATRDLSEVGRALKVDYVLDGSIQRVADRLRVTVQLVDVRNGSPLWTDAFDESFTNIFDVQDSISKRVAEALLLNLSGRDRAQLQKRDTDNIQAYQLYVRGRYHWNRRGEADLRRSIEYFEQALERDPRYALAYAGTADAYNMMANWSFMPAREAYTRAQAAAAKALAIDADLAEAQIAMVFARFLLDRDWAAADRGFQDVLAKSPAYAPGHQWYGIYLASTGQTEKAVAEVRRAAELEPLSSIINSVLSWVQYLGRQYDEAIAQCRATLEMDPNYYAAYVFLGESYEQKGMYAEARESLERARKISGGKARDLGALGHLYAKSGQRAEALKILQELERQSAGAFVEPFYVALVHIGLNDTDRALDLLEKSQQDGFPWMIHWNVSPRLDPIRSHPRFVALLRGAGLVPPSTPRTP